MISRFFISPQSEISETKNSLSNQWEKLKKVWSGETCKCIGVERFIRVLLAFQSFLFPGIYWRYIFGSSGNRSKKLAIEVYVVSKFILSMFILFKIENNKLYSYIAIYSILETVFYVLSIIFLEDIHNKVQSFSRSLILIFINYFEITIWFAVLYKNFNLTLNIKSLEALYFSFTTATTVGFGDLTPYNSPIGTYKDICMILSIIQMVIMLIFVVLFFNKFVNSINNK